MKMPTDNCSIMFFIDWFLPAYKAGGPIQSLASLIAIDSNDIQYRIICSNRDLNDEVLGVKTDQWTEFNPWTKVWYSSKNIFERAFQDDNAILFVNGVYSWHYNLKPLLLSNAKRKIVSVRGMLHPCALSQKPLKKKIYLKILRWLGLPRMVEFHATSDEEKTFIVQVFGKTARVHVAANLPRIFSKQTVAKKKGRELKLVSVALISPMKNHQLVLQALAKLGRENEDILVTYQIYGPVKDAGYWQKCLFQIESMPKNVRVMFHGDIIPPKVEEALRSGDVFILPSKSENFGHAIYEALSAGKPVITSHNTPWNSLKEKKAGLNVTPENLKELSEAIEFLAAMNSDEFEEWSRGAKSYSEQAINIEEIKEQYRRMFGLPVLKAETNRLEEQTR